MFKAMWNNFYNWAVRDASSALKGTIVFALFVVGLLSLAFSLKKGKAGVGNWFLFWIAIIATGLGIAYTITISVA